MTFERAIRVAAMTTAVALVMAVVLSLVVVLVPGVSTRVVPSPAPAYALGDVVDLPADLYSGADRTVLLFARRSCAGCQRARPLFAEIVRRYSGAPSVKVRAVMSGSDWEGDRAYAAGLGVPPEAIHRAPEDLRLERVPSLLVVDAHGRVIASREAIVYSAEAGHVIMTGLEEVLRLD